MSATVPSSLVSLVVACLAGAVLLAACDDPARPGEEPELKGLQFLIDDGHDFAAWGEPVFIDGELSASSFALAFEDSVGGLVLTSFQETEGTRGDLFILQLTDRREGELGPCGTGAECHGRLFRGIDAENIFDVERTWTVVDGTVTVSTLDADSLIGTFDDFVYEGGNPPDTLRGTGGTFRLPLLREAEGKAIMECFLTRVTGGTCG